MQDKNIQTETYKVKIHKYINTHKSMHGITTKISLLRAAGG